VPKRLERGFKTSAERLALEIRAELGLASHHRLDCNALAERLDIPVVPLTDLRADGAKVDSIRRLMSSSFKFSALTLCVGERRLIVYNPSHPTGRRANSLAHELAHVALEHPPALALNAMGCRHWDPRLEDEANWQAGTLLVPRDGALHVLRAGRSVAEAAAHFGVSEALFSWRAYHTGVVRQLAATVRRRRR
jgi:Zn-dependent peptidase ImmA (M78 family)